MEKPKVYVTSRSFGRRCARALELVKSVADVERNPYGRTMSEAELLEAVRDVDGLIVGNDKIDRKIIESARRLKIVARHGVSVSNVDLKAATENNIIVTYTPAANADAVADFTVGLMISVARHIPKAHASTIRGRWDSREFIGTEIRGKTLGIVGLGTIGTLVARRVKGFDMRVLYYSRTRKRHLERELGVQYVDLKTLLRESDFVTLHVDLTEETRGMIGAEELNLMKKSAYLINTARGPVVDEEALYKALKEKRIAGAAVDVYSKEPPSADFPLFELDNVVTTPHIAAYTEEAIKRMDMMNAEDVVRFFSGKKPEHIANVEVLERLKERGVFLE